MDDTSDHRMPASTFALALCVAFCAQAWMACAQAEPPQDAESRAASVERGLTDATGTPRWTLRERMLAYHVPALSVAVIRAGRIDWARAYGVAQAGGDDAVTVHTLFQAASISKPVTAMGALRLVQQGKLALDEDVNVRLTSWKVPPGPTTTPAAMERVTLLRLLSHSAGTNMHAVQGFRPGEPLPSLLQVLEGTAPAWAAGVRVTSAPGKAFQYSGGGYCIVQQLIQDVSGRPLAAYMRAVVLDPLGMVDSTLDPPPPAIEHRSPATAPAARAYACGHDATGRVIDGRWRIHPAAAAAGLWTTPTDLARFAIELRRQAAGASDGVVLNRESARLMLVPQIDNVSCGLFIAKRKDPTPTPTTTRFYHSGSNEGFRCFMLMSVEGGDGVIIMTNADRGDELINEVLRSVAAVYQIGAF
jgi:CubicO group peptidase (beta-lactamase class C family)